MNKLISLGLALIVLFTLILEPHMDYKLKHSLVPLFLGIVLLFPNKITWKLGLLVCCWGVINLILRDQYAAEPTVFHFGYWVTKYSFNTSNTFFDLIFLWWFPMYVYGVIILFLTRKKVRERYLSPR